MVYYVERQNKYRNIKKTYDGYTYDSMKEANYAFELDLRKKAGEIKDWERQYKLDLRANGIHICNYYVDFKVEYPDGSIQLVEIKGFISPVWQLKVKIMEATYLHDHPEVEYLVVK